MGTCGFSGKRSSQGCEHHTCEMDPRTLEATNLADELAGHASQNHNESMAKSRGTTSIESWYTGYTNTCSESPTGCDCSHKLSKGSRARLQLEGNQTLPLSRSTNSKNLNTAEEPQRAGNQTVDAYEVASLPTSWAATSNTA